ncbi:hypothetical protein P171DRAFT_408364 [Karstenula rhodostoma CBS 690.94]|uniref:HMG box domain-containing protein n=1 Tax=Karstenula rhodostoma CBS 690.94 TaxID=1392251 RepID=A0A9P4PPL0_9PLEO|nr:hypothetical protein P171DRAFT_408364 [Karstenula rhodostoma CBS 690.94]
MLARGALCRLAADVPKTSTHDLPRISQLLRTSLFARHGASQPTVGAIARAFRATILEGRRAYATKSATEPTARVKREVKKAVATKKTAKTTTATTAKAKTSDPKKPKKTAAKKDAPKKRAKKVLTAEEKEAQTIRELKKKALLKDSPKRAHASAWQSFASEALKASKNIDDSQSLMKEAAVKFKNLTPAEREHYNQIAIQTSEARTAEYSRWILSHTPEEIVAANLARAALKRKLGRKTRHDKLVDERHNKAPKTTAYMIFTTQRLTSDEFRGIPAVERIKLVANEWKALSPSEKKASASPQAPYAQQLTTMQVFEDQYQAAKAAAAKTAA